MRKSFLLHLSFSLVDGKGVGKHNSFFDFKVWNGSLSPIENILSLMVYIPKPMGTDQPRNFFWEKNTKRCALQTNLYSISFELPIVSFDFTVVRGRRREYWMEGGGWETFIFNHIVTNKFE